MVKNIRLYKGRKVLIKYNLIDYIENPEFRSKALCPQSRIRGFLFSKKIKNFL